MEDLYYSALVRYNNDPPVRHQYASKTLKGQKSFILNVGKLISFYQNGSNHTDIIAVGIFTIIRKTFYPLLSEFLRVFSCRDQN